MLILFPLLFTDSVQIFVGDDPVADYNFKILGGKEAIPHSRPWIGQLFYNGRFRCGCSLISKRYALTAAHCVRDDPDERNYHVVLGGHRLKSGISVGIREITEHPQYEDVKPRYDAALLLLNENVSETDRISTIRLAERSPDLNSKCIVNGWGSVKYHGSPASNVLMEANVNIFSPHNCKNSSAFDKNTMICVNESKLAGSCSGDSGGPMLCSNNNEYSEQHGIVSFGLTTSCEKGPSVYTDVSKILTWIRSKVKFTQSSEFTTTSQAQRTTTLQPESATMSQSLITDSTSITLDSISQTLKNFNQQHFDQLISTIGTNWRSENKETLLHIAAKHGYYNAAKALINKDPSLLNTTDEYHWYPLHFAARRGHCNIVSLLFSNGADVNALANFDNDDPTTPPHASALYFAAENGSVECVQILLDNGADITHKTHEGFTALHAAAQDGKFEVVKLLIEKGADINVKSNHGKTPLQKATSNGYCDIVKLLVENNADVNALAKFNIDDSTIPPHVSALYWAAEDGHTECVKILLDNGADITHKTHQGLTALHIASEEGKYDVAKVLIKKNPQLVNITDNDNWYPLHYAASRGHCSIVSLLLSNHADPNALANFGNEDSTTPPSVSALYLMASHGHVECVRILLNKGADINHQTNEGLTALHIASQNGHYEAAKVLIKKDPKLVNTTDEHHLYPLHFAVSKGHCDIVKLLLSNGADVNALTNSSISALYLAAQNGSVECVKTLLNKGANISHQDRYGQTTLHIASQLGKYEAAKVLIKKNPQLVNAANKYCWYPLHYAARNGRCDIIKLLLSNGADVNSLAKFTTDDSTTPPSVSALYLMASHGHVECVRILLNKGADINHQTNEGLTALHIASQNGYYEAAKVLIKKNPQLINSTDKDHWYPLHFAALKGHCDIIKLLLSNGADVNALGKLGNDDPTTPPHASALYFAAENGSVECIRVLLDNGANINHQDRYGQTALHIASQQGKYDVAKLLIEKGADTTNDTNNNGKTALKLTLLSLCFVLIRSINI